MFRNKSKIVRKKIIVDEDESQESISNLKPIQLANTSSDNSIQPENTQNPEALDNEPIIIKPKQKPKKAKKTLISFNQDDEEEENTSFKLTKSKASLNLSKTKRTSNFGIIDDEALNLGSPSLSNSNNSRSYDIDELDKLKKLTNNNGKNLNKPISDEDLVRSKFSLEFENIPNIKKSINLNQDFIGFNKSDNNTGLTVIDDEEDFKIDENPETPQEGSEDNKSQASSEDEEVRRWELEQIQRANPQNKKVVEKLKTTMGPPQHPGTKVIPLPDFKTAKVNWHSVKETSEMRLKLIRESKEEIERNINNIRSRKEAIDSKISEIDSKLNTLTI